MQTMIYQLPDSTKNLPVIFI